MDDTQKGEMPVTAKREDLILACLRHQDAVRREDIARFLGQTGQTCSKVTLLRDLNRLFSLGLVEKSGQGRAVRYSLSRNWAQTQPIDVATYFSKGADSRPLRSEYFNFELFGELQHLLTADESAEMDALNAGFRLKRDKLSPGLLRKEYERLTIELAWKSSKIEGNSYSLLDTEFLLRQNVTAGGKTIDEAMMVLDHKRAMEHVLSAPEYYKDITVQKIEELHRLLTEGLHVTSGIRSGMVGITGTNYRPLDNEFQIRDAMGKLSDMLNGTHHAVERALLAVLMVSYIQPFEDGNKRTSRILGNALLVSDDYCPLSYSSVEEKEYKKAMILFYEQNNVSCFKNLFLDQFRMAVKKYF
ncbi:MAG: Fic family protein [Desulfovibrionaceae bacterium]|nr:Fic family protein [Desulfovibrionaceae bacterium]